MSEQVCLHLVTPVQSRTIHKVRESARAKIPTKTHKALYPRDASNEIMTSRGHLLDIIRLC